MYKLYYSSDGKPLYYSMDNATNGTLSWVEITEEQYRAATAQSKFTESDTTLSSDNSVPGFLFHSDVTVLSALARTVPAAGTIVEVGSYFGKSAVIMASSVSSTVQIYCIDAFPQDYIYREKYKFLEYDKKYNMREEFLNNTKAYNNIHMIVGRSPHSILEEYKNKFDSLSSIDMFFIDAEHTNPSDWDNITYFLPRIKTGGILCGHDYTSKYPDVIHNIHELEKMLNKSVQLYNRSSMWSFRI